MTTATNPIGTIYPLADRVLLRPIEDVKETRGGLYIPHLAKDTPQAGQIIAVGPGRFDKGTRVPMELEPGQNVLYGRYNGTEVTLDGENLLIIGESDVLAVIG